MDKADRQALRDLIVSVDSEEASNVVPITVKKPVIKEGDIQQQAVAISNIPIDEAVGAILTHGSKALGIKFGSHFELSTDEVQMCTTSYVAVIDEEFPDLSEKIDSMGAKGGAIIVTALVFLPKIMQSIMDAGKNKKMPAAVVDKAEGANKEVSASESIKSQKGKDHGE